MTDQPTPENIKAALDELAMWRFKYGLDFMAHRDEVELITADRPGAGLGAEVTRSGDWVLHSFPYGDVESIRPGELSNHQKMEILGNRSPDLARMLREAFMAGVNSTPQGWEYRDEFENEATEYAAKIIGGEG